MSREMSGGSPGERFAHLPSAKLLVDLIEGWRFEDSLKWDAYGGEDDFPILGQLWMNADIFARSTLSASPKDVPASTFIAEWAKIDRVHGDPLRRGWLMSSIEARLRAHVVLAYLHSSGLLSLRQAESDAPQSYFTDEELGD